MPENIVGFPMMIWHASVHSPIVACLTTPLLARTHRPHPVHSDAPLRTPTTSPLAKTSAHHSDHSLRHHASALQQCDRQATVLSRRPDPYRSLRPRAPPRTSHCSLPVTRVSQKQAVLKHLHCSRQCLHLLVHKRLLAHRKAVRSHDSGWRASPTLSLSDHIDTVRPVALTCHGRKTDNSPSSSLLDRCLVLVLRGLGFKTFLLLCGLSKTAIATFRSSRQEPDKLLCQIHDCRDA